MGKALRRRLDTAGQSARALARRCERPAIFELIFEVVCAEGNKLGSQQIWRGCLCRKGTVIAIYRLVFFCVLRSVRRGKIRVT